MNKSYFIKCCMEMWLDGKNDCYEKTAMETAQALWSRRI